jgi:hypothetical protein
MGVRKGSRGARRQVLRQSLMSTSKQPSRQKSPPTALRCNILAHDLPGFAWRDTLQRIIRTQILLVLARLDIALHCRMTAGIRPIASASTDRRANGRDRGHCGRRLNTAQASP